MVSSNPRWSQKTREIPLSYGVDISTDNYSVSSQSTRVTDGPTDRITMARACVAYMYAVAR